MNELASDISRTPSVTMASLVWKGVVAHTITYFVVGFAAYTLFDYATLFAEPALSGYMRSTEEPIVRAGVLFQPVRGALFGLVFYWLRDAWVGRRLGWLVLWGTLVVVGIWSTFGPSPGSIEGLIYTKVPPQILSGGQLEVMLQSLLLASLVAYWVHHPQQRWLDWLLAGLFIVTMGMPILGLLLAPA